MHCSWMGFRGDEPSASCLRAETPASVAPGSRGAERDAVGSSCPQGFFVHGDFLVAESSLYLYFCFSSQILSFSDVSWFIVAL